MKPDYIAIGKRIRFHRRMQDITQIQLAKAIGCSASFLGHVERGTRTMSVDTLCGISEALKLSTDYILGYKENPT